MSAPQYCFFLVYRTTHHDEIDWDHPTGGLVMEPKDIIDGIPLSDINLAEEVSCERYHCDPNEWLMIAEVWNNREKCLAAHLHREYEREMEDFHALMLTA